MTPHPPWPAMLLLGPTGSGKSPLGDLLERRGLAGRPCVHFDFGRHLRRADAEAAAAAAAGLSDEDRAVIGRVLRDGALLECETFGIALKILDGFVAERHPAAGTLLVMNGLPRHAGQARLLDSRLRMERVVLLECSAETVLARVRLDTGGDRAGRPDDDLASVRRRLDLYAARTAPLADHYAARGAVLHRIPIAADTTPHAVLDRLAARIPPGP